MAIPTNLGSNREARNSSEVRTPSAEPPPRVKNLPRRRRWKTIATGRVRRVYRRLGAALNRRAERAPPPAFVRVANFGAASPLSQRVRKQTMTRVYVLTPIARNGAPTWPATNAARIAGAGGTRESGETIASRSQAIDALSD